MIYSHAQKQLLRVTAFPTVGERWDALRAWLVDRHGFSALAESVQAMESGIMVAFLDLPILGGILLLYET